MLIWWVAALAWLGPALSAAYSGWFSCPLLGLVVSVALYRASRDRLLWRWRGLRPTEMQLAAACAVVGCLALPAAIENAIDRDRLALCEHVLRDGRGLNVVLGTIADRLECYQPNVLAALETRGALDGYPSVTVPVPQTP